MANIKKRRLLFRVDEALGLLELECLVKLMEWPEEGGVRRLVGIVLPFDAMVKTSKNR